MEKILLHTCCAPCSASIIPLLQSGYDIVSFWYNPNIYPSKENVLRKNAWQSYMQKLNIETSEKNAQWLEDDNLYDGLWLDKALKYEKGRCYFCYKIRLEQTAERARQLSVKNFSTTLLSSPYQKHDVIKQLAKDIADRFGLNFVYADPRKNFYTGVNAVKKLGLYSQKYCGCKLSVRN